MLRFGSTQWHPEPQWLLQAWDVDKDAERDFALAGFHAAHQPDPHDIEAAIWALSHPWQRVHLGYDANRMQVTADDFRRDRIGAAVNGLKAWLEAYTGLTTDNPASAEESGQ